MDEEDLTASHWDDVISPNSGSKFGTFGSSILPPVLNNEFSGMSIFDDDDYKPPNQTEDAYEPSYEYEQSTVKSPEEEQHDELKRDERKHHKEQLISELTHGAEENELEQSVFSPKKIEVTDNLFNNSESPIKFDSARSENDTIEEAPSPTRSTKLKNTKLYKAPRPRKYNSKIVAKHLNEGKTDSEAMASLGPLGLAVEDDPNSKESTESDNKAKLVEEADAPLYNISRSSDSTAKESSYLHTGLGDNTSSTEGRNSSEVSNPETGTPESSNQLAISVGDPMKVGDIATAHIVYSIKVRNKNLKSNKFPQQEEVTVSRRYKDFRWIYHQLQNNHPGRIIPPPPAKQTYIGRFNETFIENRRLSLEKMLTKICNLPILCNDADFVLFLTSEDFVNEAKERERLSGSGASMQNDDFLDSENGANDDNSSSNTSMGSVQSSAPILSGGAGFMSSLFSISSKVNEPDEYYSQKRAYVEDLETNLKQFYKSIELIVTQRHELACLLDEISLAADELAGIEISKTTTELLASFSEIQLKLKENLERINLQDQLTLGFTIEEYLRVIGSVKYIFENRTKIYQQYYTFNQDLTRKQAQLDKLQRKYKSQVEKINQLNFEIDKLKQKTSSYEKKFVSISETIKSEMEKFEFDKIDDFRNSVEIFIESSIEAQKEAIELWETFYERQDLAKV